MYVPPAFNEDRVDVLQAALRQSGLATLVTLTDAGLIASHVPILLDPEPAPYGTLRDCPSALQPLKTEWETVRRKAIRNLRGALSVLRR